MSHIKFIKYKMNGHSTVNICTVLNIKLNTISILQKIKKTMYHSDDDVIWKDLQVPVSWVGL